VSGAELSWEISGPQTPHVEPGEYEGVILSWKLERPFGRFGIAYEVELVSGPYHDVTVCSEGDGMYTPSDRYRGIEGVRLAAHFNLGRSLGGGRMGRRSKLAHAFMAVFDGRPPDRLRPDLLVGRRVRCRVKTVTTDSDDNPLHRSCWYSKVATFLGPGLGDDPLPF
jgi:hypothetical protein